MNQQQTKIQTHKELEQEWDDFSVGFSENASPSTASLYLSMLTMLQVEKSDSILEIAVGSGYLIPYLLQKKKPEAKLFLTDLSAPFLSITQKRIQLFQQNKQNELYNFDLKDVPLFTQPVHIDQYNTTLSKANSENLVDFKDNSIETYISSLCLQLTTDPKKMAEEAFRVLKPGGKACMSVWGEQDNSLFFTVAPKILAQNGVQLPNERSNFHLNDRQKLIDMFKKIGFVQPLCWNQFFPINQVTNDKQLDKFLSGPDKTQLINLAPEEKRESIKKQIKDEYLNILNNKNQAIGLDTIVIMVTKPEQ